ncbi:16S rRNA (adenine(1518)-N(6)/adenine(1519)-N(6))-dimethyltransferase RsmA [Lactococcus termiticola]|uniref:Ribosomal RNA small subunit methyltransferase A n=1 Tax=Lactococcus termiticola TaxID=2169526 RepID=A0A2R5HFZ7_9LACT|nr:16S rRNA (adenine(1518)-N(6)/adenine(1519)-N(6))-dimethyltransferase RsmA [Lactococcus termiticola]GBG96944.1 dimethyladenosine transferase [Lactococcus termiticola]
MTETDIKRIANIIRTQDILRRHDFNFKKKFGQNFLTDGNILSKITEAAELSKEVNVIEIGPGIGSLTQYLLEESAEVMAFEIDKTLIPILEETLADYDNFQLVNADILKVDLKAEIAKFKNPDLPIKVVANLPYYITTPILMALIESKIPFASFVVMMQKEVADRIAAKPNTKAYGSLSIAVQYYLKAEVAFNVPRTVFVPAPNVDSAILKMTRLDQPAVDVPDEDWYFRLMKLSFVHRRKTLLNNLQSAFGKDRKEEILGLLDRAGISPTARAESFDLEDFAKLSIALLPMKD